MIPRRLITLWITDRERDGYSDAHRETFARCMTSWLRLMPGWDVRIVTSGNVFEYGGDPTAERWLREGHFIGVAQWARLHWLRTLGGVALDADVEAVKPFDALLDARCAVGHEGGDAFANNAVVAAEPGHPFLSEQMRAVLACDPLDRQFGNETGPRQLTRLLIGRGWDAAADKTQVVGLGLDAVTVLRSDVLYPHFYRPTSRARGVTKHTLAVHHWAASWVHRNKYSRLSKKPEVDA